MAEEKLEKWLISTLILGSLIILPLLEKSQVATYGLIPCCFVYFFRKDMITKNRPRTKLYSLFIIFFIWSSAVSLLADDSVAAFQTQKRMLIVILYLYPILSLARSSEEAQIVIFQCHLISLAILISYVFFGPDIEIDVVSREQREIGVFNANAYGYYIYIGMICGLNLLANSIYKLRYSILLAFAALGSLIVLLMTSSRGGFLMFGITICLGVFAFLKRDKYLVVKLIVCLFLGYGISDNLYNRVFSGSHLFARYSELGERSSPRQQHFSEAIKIGWNNPLVGVGGGNYAAVQKTAERGSFSHNSYSESFANYGFVGFFLFLAMYLEYFITLKRVSKQVHLQDQVRINIHYVFLVSLLCYSVFYVTYLTMQFMGTLLIFRTQLGTFENQILTPKGRRNSLWQHQIPSRE